MEAQSTWIILKTVWKVKTKSKETELLRWWCISVDTINMCLYSETTGAVGITQLTNHEVPGGGKNPETEGRGIFSPTVERVVS